MSDIAVSSEELWVCHLGLLPYSDALAIQETLRARRQAGEIPDTLLLLQHPPVYTLGRRSAAGDLPLGEDYYRAKGIEVVATNRGGKLTYHGPGQLVGYPIMAIEDIGHYLRRMEEAIIAALAEEGIQARTRHEEGIDYTGVWVAHRKIASIGLHVSRGVSTHGFAVNVDNDLAPFTCVVPCGLPEVTMTSLERELPPGQRSGLPCFRRRLAFHFANVHRRRQRLISPWRLGIDTTNASPLAERGIIKSSPQPRRETIPA